MSLTLQCFVSQHLQFIPSNLAPSLGGLLSLGRRGWLVARRRHAVVASPRRRRVGVAASLFRRCVVSASRLRFFAVASTSFSSRRRSRRWLVSWWRVCTEFCAKLHFFPKVEIFFRLLAKSRKTPEFELQGANRSRKDNNLKKSKKKSKKKIGLNPNSSHCHLAADQPAKSLPFHFKYALQGLTTTA